VSAARTKNDGDDGAGRYVYHHQDAERALSSQKFAPCVPIVAVNSTLIHHEGFEQFKGTITLEGTHKCMHAIIISGMCYLYPWRHIFSIKKFYVI
jgi:hypothetical protein